MKTFFMMMVGTVLITACNNSIDKDAVKKEVFSAEKAFEKMAAEKSISEAFYYFADENATIRRENDTLIMGKENIKAYYEKRQNTNATVNWTPDYIDVSADGTMGYSYGKYVWKIKDAKGEAVEYKGVFHTVWKKQKDGGWKYVWD